MCNKLLVGEADEDVNWTDDKFLSPSQRRKLEGNLYEIKLLLCFFVYFPNTT